MQPFVIQKQNGLESSASTSSRPAMGVWGVDALLGKALDRRTADTKHHQVTETATQGCCARTPWCCLRCEEFSDGCSATACIAYSLL